MQPFGADELVLIRHAPADHGGRLAGRFDPPLRSLENVQLEALQKALRSVRLWASPARRCQATVDALCGSIERTTDSRLWEQDFGAEDGARFSDLPDLGPLSLPELAARRPIDGESFAQMVERVRPALVAAAKAVRTDGKPIAIIAHAGTVRAGLALAMNRMPETLAFEIAPLSVTRLRCYADGLSIISVNEQLVPA